MRGEVSRLAELRQERARAFRKEVLPYLRYMGQSGFPSFLSLLFIASAIGYVQLIRHLPADFPIVPVGVIALTPLLAWSPLRTYLFPADIVFIMPREAEMGEYLSKSLRGSFFKTGWLAAAVFMLYMPIYLQGDANIPAWLLAIGLLLVKGGNMAGACQERRMAWSGIRRISRLLRWTLTALAVAAWLTALWWQAAAFMVLCGLLAWLCCSLPKKQRLNWERLIHEETMTRKRYYAFFGMFIDVPVLAPSVSRRPYLDWIIPRIRYAHSQTFVFLYGASLIRSELGGILVRILLLGGLVCYMAADSQNLAGWAAVFAYVLTGLVYGLQLSGLRAVHCHSVWKHVYPLPEEKQIEQLLRVDRAALIAGLLLLWLPAALPLLIGGLFAPPLAALAAAFLYAATRPARLRRKLRVEADED
ncbi:ABC transporter permease [Paenibacillus soyae]|uniref:ABC transporter permease n=1 Tax=Paenibacillus soyae TaxID=2969249 RepID=A0A9X2MKW6_9BACL|nr:ABC transporter permease [Paenibacillus soyae]MCR2802541.1 ABC transporter permease [Paenibacillus soyae]